MATIGDGEAVSEDSRVFSHHQLAIQLIDTQLSVPEHTPLSMLDVACGRGQMIRSMKHALPAQALERIRYVGYDAEQSYAKETLEVGGAAELNMIEARVGEVADLHHLILADEKFDLILLTNTVHELSPKTIPGLVVDLLLRLSHDGQLFIYDLESEDPPELGAVAWYRSDIERLAQHIYAQLGSSYGPAALQWPLKSAAAWSLTLRRSSLGVADRQIVAKRDATISASISVIKEILLHKLATCTEALTTLTINGTETEEEERFRMRQLFDHWAVTRALRGLE